MKTEAQIRDYLATIESDDRLWYSPASVEINAPLALIQVNLETKSGCLRWILDESPRPFKRPKAKGGR